MKTQAPILPVSAGTTVTPYRLFLACAYLSRFLKIDRDLSLEQISGWGMLGGPASMSISHVQHTHTPSTNEGASLCGHSLVHGAWLVPAPLQLSHVRVSRGFSYRRSRLTLLGHALADERVTGTKGSSASPTHLECKQRQLGVLCCRSRVISLVSGLRLRLSALSRPHVCCSPLDVLVVELCCSSQRIAGGSDSWSCGTACLSLVSICA